MTMELYLGSVPLMLNDQFTKSDADELSNLVKNSIGERLEGKKTHPYVDIMCMYVYM